MSAAKYKIYEKSAKNQYEAIIEISSADLIECVDCNNDHNYLVKVKNGSNRNIAKLSRVMSDIQRGEKNSSFVNKGLFSTIMEYQEMVDKGAPEMECRSLIPCNNITLCAEPTKRLKDSRFLLVVDGKQRLSSLKRVAEKLGKEVKIKFSVVIFESLTVKEVAEKFMVLNTCNAMASPDLVNAAFHAGHLDVLWKQMKKSAKKGYIRGYTVVPRENPKNECNELSAHTFLTMLGYGLCGTTNKHRVIGLSGEYSQLAVDSVLHAFSILFEEVGFKRFRKGAEKRSHDYNVFSSMAFICCVARLAMNHPLTENGVDSKNKLTDDIFRLWLQEIRDTKGGKARDFRQMCQDNNNGSFKSCHRIYMSLTKEATEGIASFGIIGQKTPSGKSKPLYVKAGSAMSSIPCLALREGSILRGKTEEETA